MEVATQYVLGVPWGTYRLRYTLSGTWELTAEPQPPGFGIVVRVPKCICAHRRIGSDASGLVSHRSPPACEKRTTLFAGSTLSDGSQLLASSSAFGKAPICAM